MILHLTLKKKWFDMISSGEKKEEYREIKMYWATRLCTGFPSTYGIDIINPDFKQFDYIIFKNGYTKNAPSIKVECLGISIGKGNYHWGALMQKDMYIIKLGEVINDQPANNDLPYYEDDTDEEEFIECSKCDGHDACRDFGCAFEAGLGHLVRNNDFEF